MSDEVLAYASVLMLTRSDIVTLKVKDAYSLHRVIYGLFDNIRSDYENNPSSSSGILWVDKGVDQNNRKILILSDRKPHLTPQFGEVSIKGIKKNFMNYSHYGFEIVINPCKKNKVRNTIEPILGVENISEWFINKVNATCGFNVNKTSLQIKVNSVQSFQKGDQKITHNSVSLKGELTVVDKDKFIYSFIRGIGRGKAFGFGLLQIIPFK